jgi:hypothetical protein
MTCGDPAERPARIRPWRPYLAAAAVLAVLAMAVAGAATLSDRRSAGGQPSRSTTPIPAAALPATAAACTAPASLTGPPKTDSMPRPAVGADAAAWLRATASTLLATPSDSHTGRYAHIRQIAWYGDMTVGADQVGRTDLRLEVSEGWYAEDGAATTITAVYPPGTNSPDLGVKPKIERWDALPGEVHTYIPGQPSPDPDELLTQLGRIQPPEVGPQRTMRAIAAVAGRYHLTCPVRAAMLHLLATAPIIWRGPVTDRTGRPGVAVSIDSPDGVGRDTLTIDPATGSILAYHELILRNPGKLAGPFPQDRAYTAFLHNGRADTIPAGTATPAS